MKIAVVGAGGVGGYFGGKISSSGYDVTFVARGEHLKAMREKGLKVNSILGDFSVSPAQATDDIGSIGKVDLVILGVKAWQVKEAALHMKGLVGDQTTILPLQNGIMAAEELGGVFADKNIIGGLCRIISRIESPGVIRHSGLEPFIAFGELDHRKTDRIGKIKRMFDAAGIVSRIADDIHAELWSKFMAICVSGLLAVTRSTYGRVRELPETRVLMRELLREIHVVASKAGQALDPDIVEKTMALIDSYPYESNSSLTRDVMEGRPSEIEYQNGTVVRLGREYGVDVPINRFIYSSILPMESAARAKADI
jgi:2-dehydropantoate 2-reductase